MLLVVTTIYIKPLNTLPWLATFQLLTRSPASRLPSATADKLPRERVFISRVVNCTQIDLTQFTTCLTRNHTVGAKSRFLIELLLEYGGQ